VAGMGTSALPVHRLEMATRDMDVIAGLINHRYAEHRASFRCSAPGQVDASMCAATTGLVEAAVLRFRGFDYRAQSSPPDDFLAAVVLHGAGTLATATERLHFTRGDVLLDPADVPFAANLLDSAFAALRIPRQVVGELAEQYAGLPAASLRFESMAPVSGAARALWSQTVGFLCRQLIGSGMTEVSALVAQEMARLAAAALLETFPNTTMTAAHNGSPGRVAPAAVRRAAAFMDSHAGQPVTVSEVAAVAGTTARALQYAFRRHYDTTPTGYLRRVRLERAHRQLQAADPATGATVAEIAGRWGWASPAQFATAYRKRYGMPPSHTLRG
jgi:AraC-like DNA-binding protein